MNIFESQIAAALEESRRTAEKEAQQRGEVESTGSIISIPKGKRPFDAALFGETVRGGFAKLFKDQSLSDIVLLIGEEKIPAHRLVLCAWSDTFRAMLESGAWAESGAKELKINVEEEEGPVFKLMLEYMYTGNADFVDDDNVLPLITLTNYYGVHALKEVCGRLLGEQLSDGNIFYLLDVVDKYDCKTLEVKCGEYLATNFEDMWNDDEKQLLSLRLDTWAAMLASDDLWISSERRLCEIVLKYVNTRFDDNEQREAALNKLLPHIRFAAVPPEHLVTIFEKDETLGRLPIVHSMLYQAFRFKAYPTIKPTFNTKMRHGFQKFDPEQKGSNISLSNEDTTASCTAGGWQSARLTNPFDELNVYVEFNVTTVVNLMLGVVVGNANMQSGYVGQFQNGYVIYNSDGNFYYQATNTSKGAQFTSGDKIGVSYDISTRSLTFYKNKNKLFTHNINVTHQEKVYPVLSLTGANTVSIVQSPDLPSDLTLLQGSRGGRFGRRGRKNKQTTSSGLGSGLVAPTPILTTPLSTPNLFGGFGATTTATPAFGTTKPASFSFGQN